MSKDPMNAEKQAELQSLLDAVCDDTLDDTQSERLQQMLSEDEQALEYYVEFMWLHDGITRLTDGYESRIDESKYQATFEIETHSTGMENDMVTTASRTVQWGDDSKSTMSMPFRLNFGMLALLGSLLVAAAILFWIQSNQSAIVEKSPPPSEIPNLALVTPDKKDDNTATLVSMSDELVRQELADGTVVVARPGSQFEVTEHRKISLKRGELFLIVAKSGTPFVVTTPEGEVHATGTRFNVSTTSNSTTPKTQPRDGSMTQAAVAQGQVVLKSATGDVILGVGQQGTLVRDDHPTRRPAKRLSHLVSWAQDALQQAERLVPPAPRENGLIAIDPYGQEARLTLRKYKIDVYVEDGIARTTIDQTFFNHNPWNTEGTFYFPLPPDASVSRLAMYVAGELNEGGMVSRQRGQEIYTDILYQRRDPALLEMMEGNMFKLRIFPLEGRQEKRIFLSYTQNLDELYGSTKYWFPMDHTQDVANELTISVRIKDGVAIYEPTSSTHDLKTTVDGNDLLLEYTASKIKPDQDFLLGLQPKTDAKNVAENNDENATNHSAQPNTPQPKARVAVCEYEGQKYLTARINPDLSGNMSPEPRQWIVINDVSASRSRIEARAQRHILARLIEEADDGDSVFLMDLNTEARNVSVEPVNVRSKQIQPLLNHRSKRLIGATDIAAGLDAANQTILKYKMPNPHIVYLGDGVATEGEKAIAELPRLVPNRCKFIGVGIGKKVDSLFLNAAANQTGGMFTIINPDEDINWRVFDMLAALNTPRMTGIRVELLDEKGQPMEAIAYPSSSVLASGETLTVTALCNTQLPSKIKFTGRVNKRPVSQTVTLENAKPSAKYLPRLWAKLHIDNLLKSGMANQEEIVALSKSFYVVTPFTSLLVLEDDAMYEEYQVERGRKDHWAKYNAPTTIDVVKEPVDWNRWGWGQFEGEDGKIKTQTRPQTVQEIIDNVQVRVDAPFYLWPEGQRDSRHGLYQICDQTIEPGGDATRLLTLGFLLASGQRKSAIEFGQGVTRQQAGVSANMPRSVTRSSKLSLLARYEPQLFGTSSLSTKSRFLMPTRNEFFGRSGQFAVGGKRVTSSFFAIDGRFERRGLPQLSGQGMGGFGFDYRPVLTGTIPPISGLLRQSPMPATAAPFDPRIAGAFQQALATRWSRIQKDINQYNTQHGYAGRGGWGNTWQDQDGLGLNGNTNWFSNELREILSITDVGFARETDGYLVDIDRVLPGLVELEFKLRTGTNLQFQSDMPYTTDESILDFFSPGGDQQSNFFRSNQMGLNGRLLVSQSLFSGQEAMFGKSIPFAAFQSVPQASSRIRQYQWLAQSQAQLPTQPGMASVLAADLLHERLGKLNQLPALNESQTAEKLAIEMAIAKLGQASARIESGKQFWGHQGWSYQPSPARIDAPTVQAYMGHGWSFDLARYAGGLSSNGFDMMHEVAKQYGQTKPRGKISQVARAVIEKSRNNFSPVSIEFEDDGTQFLVGPNDQFAFSSRNSMYLTESLTCDGQQILQSYEELGLVARREASDIRLNELRALAPHLLASADEWIIQFDVELIDSVDDQFTLKLTFPVPEEDANELSAKQDLDVDSQASEKVTDSRSEDERPYLLVTADRNGRLLSRRWMSGEAALLTVNFAYDEESVKVEWELAADEKDTESNQGSSNYSARSFAPTPTTFAPQLDQQVVIEMPLKKPSYYQQQFNELSPAKDGENEVDAKTIAAGDLIPRQSLGSAISLLRHQILSQTQDFNSNPWDGRHSQAIQVIPKLLKLQKRMDTEPLRGDLALMVTAGAQPNQFVEVQRIQAAKRKVEKNSELIQFFANRSNWVELNRALKHKTGLIGHLANYHAVVYGGQAEDLARFNKQFNDSPLRLAAVSGHYGHFKIENLLQLNEDPQWSGIALMVASVRCSTDADMQLVTTAFWKWHAKLKEQELSPVLFDAVVRVLQANRNEKFTELLKDRLEKTVESKSLPAILDLAERLSVWGNKELADQAYLEAQTQLGMLGDDTSVALLKRFAYANSLWAGNRYVRALKQFDLILDELEQKQIPLSPAFCASLARLASQAGESKRAVELEERALELEQPYLPSAINLQAFRQRYQWLWNQYVSAINEIDTNDSNRESKVSSVVSRAEKTWDRWAEIDRDNPNLPVQMATLLKTAGRETEAWEYLSSLIDQKPRDAATYTQVGNWYRQTGDLAQGVRWLGEAPQWDTANPQWIFNYASALKELGRKSEAKVQFNKIINGKWAPGLQQWADKARNEL